MVGANYMGGKRSTVRAKSRDVVGRAQRCHFGKQRLASALCATQESRVRPSLSMSSVLPEIALAHARCHASIDSDASSSIKVYFKNRSILSTPPSNTVRRNKPSKVLGALDVSDHMFMRAAIERILRQPDLIGIGIPKRKDAACIEPMQTPTAVRRPTDAHLNSQDRDTWHPGIVSKYIFDPQASDSQIQEHELAGLPKSGLNRGHEPTESGFLSLPNSPLEIWDKASPDAFGDPGYAQVQLFTGTNRIGVQEPEWPYASLDAVPPLPRSSPFSSSSQLSDNSILDLDTSPWTTIRPERSGDPFEKDIDRIGASSPRSVHQPVSHQPSRSFAISGGSAGLDEVQFTNPSLTSLIEEELEVKDFQTTCCTDGRAFPSIGNDGSRRSSESRSGHGSIRIMTGSEVAEDDARNAIFIDFLSDPHPWETIGRILKLKPPEASAVHSVTINFTKDREGVGYVSLEKSSTPLDDAHIASWAVLPIPDSEVSIVDNRMTIDTQESSRTGNSAWPLHSAGLPQGEIGIHPVQVVDHGTDNKHTPSSTPSTNIAGTTTAEPDTDMTFGPCLFGDSDLEEDE